MINVNQITSQLAKMPDQSLQKYAAMHKNDPYTVSLALAESNRRKEMRASSQAQMAGQQQPKVVDQEVAQMLPEEVGIGQLPAQNIQHMASGGIVAFEEGGEVPRYYDGGTPQALPGGLGIYSQGAFAPQPGAVENQTWAQRKMDEIAAKVAAGTASPQEKMWLSMFGGGAKERVAARQQDASQSGIDMGGPGSSPANMGAAKPVITPAPNGAQPPTSAPTGAAPAAQPAPGLPGINSYMKQFEAALPKKEEAQSEEDFMAKREEPMKAFFEKANKQIETERSRLKTDKEQDFYMSLIQGGLAAAAESGPNALQNIAKGFSTGAASYKDALKDFRKASQENNRMEMDLMKAKAADKKGDMDSYQKHMEAVAERNAKIDGYKSSGLASIIGHQISANATITAAGMPSGTERLINRIGTDKNFASAYEKYASMGPAAKLPNQILAKYADPKELMKLKVMDPALYEQVKAQLDMATGMGAGIPQVMTQPSGAVRP